MNKTVDKLSKVFHIDSELRNSGTADNFDIIVKMPHRNAFNKASIQYAEFDSFPNMPKVLYLRCDNITNNDDNILCAFYPVGYTNLVQYFPADTYTNSVSVIDSNTNLLKFSLVSNTGASIDLNGGNVRFTLTFWNE